MSKYRARNFYSVKSNSYGLFSHFAPVVYSGKTRHNRDFAIGKLRVAHRPGQHFGNCGNFEAQWGFWSKLLATKQKRIDCA